MSSVDAEGFMGRARSKDSQYRGGVKLLTLHEGYRVKVWSYPLALHILTLDTLDVRKYDHHWRSLEIVWAALSGGANFPPGTPFIDTLTGWCGYKTQEKYVRMAGAASGTKFHGLKFEHQQHAAFYVFGVSARCPHTRRLLLEEIYVVDTTIVLSSSLLAKSSKGKDYEISVANVRAITPECAQFRFRDLVPTLYTDLLTFT